MLYPFEWVCQEDSDEYEARGSWPNQHLFYLLGLEIVPIRYSYVSSLALKD